jgi:hypothetical protein
LLLSLAAGTANAASSSTFTYEQGFANLTLTLTAAADTGDLAFRLAAPAQYDWVAIGIGAQMKGALMFIAYATKNGSGKQHLEPTLRHVRSPAVDFYSKQ